MLKFDIGGEMGYSSLKDLEKQYAAVYLNSRKRSMLADAVTNKAQFRIPILWSQ